MPEAGQIETMMQLARQEMEVVKRQAVVYSLYSRTQKNVMVRELTLLIVSESQQLNNSMHFVYYLQDLKESPAP